MPFNKRVSFSYSSPALPYARPTVLQSQKFRGLSSQAGYPRLNSLMWGSDFSLFGKNLCNCHYPPILGLPTWLWVLIIFSLPPFSLWFLLYIFSCGKYFLLVFSYQIVAPKIVVILVCPWKEVSSASSHPAILAILLAKFAESLTLHC